MKSIKYESESVIIAKMAAINRSRMSTFVEGIVTGMIAIALWTAATQIWIKGLSLLSRLSATTRRKIVFVAFAGWFGAVILLFGWYLPGIYSDDVALATGSSTPFLVWLFAALMSLVLSGQVRDLKRWKGGFLVATPLMILNLFVPSFHSIPFATATPAMRSWFDVAVGGGAIGEGLFLITFWAIGVRVAKSKLGLSTQTISVASPPEEVPYNYPTSIFSQFVHVIRGPRSD